MTVRWNAGDPHGVPSGYNGPDVPEGVHVPSCGIEDVDFALFQLFDKEIGFQTRVKRGQELTVSKVPVIFTVGEKWAMNKRNSPFRDKEGSLILPLISVVRPSIVQTPDSDQRGRGINQATGELVFRRQLGPKDREYQNLINNMRLRNQTNLPIDQNTTPIGTLREVGENAYDADVRQGALLAIRNGRHIWEFLTIPAPQFYTAKYEITFWAQYRTQMNAMIEKLMASYLPQLPCLKVTTKAGYWFIAYVDGQFTAEDNHDDMTENERGMKVTFTLEIPAYTVAPQMPGMPSPVRRYYSVPEVSFDISGEKDMPNGSIDQGEKPAADGADDPTLGYSLSGEVQPRPTGDRDKFYASIVKNPFTGRERAKYVKVVSVNSRQGETVYHPIDGGFEFDLD